MPRVKAEPDERGVDPAHQLVDLVRRLDVRAGMRMEDRLQALATADLGGRVEVVDEPRPAMGVQLGLGMALDAARVGDPRRLVDALAEHREGR